MKNLFTLSVVFLLSCSTPPPSDFEIFKEFYQPYTEFKTFKTASPDLEKKLNEGLKLYLSKEYNDAFDVFSGILGSPFEKEITASFYSGLCLMNSDFSSPELKETVESLFIDLIKHNRNPFTRQANWYLSLFYFKNNDGEKALPLLEFLAESEGPFQTESKTILAKVR